MIEYVIPESPDDRILDKACEIIREGGLVALPTDTSWIVVANPFNKKGVSNIYRFKGADKLKHLSLLCENFSKASEVAVISDVVFKTLRKVIPGHYTFIFEATKKIIRAVQANKTDHSVGLRFVPSHLVTKLLERYGDSLISTNFEKERMGLKESDSIYSYLIEEKYAGDIEMIIDPGEYEFVGPSTIIDYSEDFPQLVREGAGPFPFK